MAASSAAIKLRWPTKLSCNDYQCLIQSLSRLEVTQQGRDRLIQLIDQHVLLQLPFVVRVPACTVDEIQIE